MVTLLSFVWLLGLFPAAPSEQSRLAAAGSFKVLVDGKPAGWERFEISHDGEVVAMKSTGELFSRGSSLTLKTVTEIRNGNPTKYSVDVTENGRLRRYAVVFRRVGALVTIEAGNRRSERDVRLSSNVVVLDDNVWHQYSLLIARYNRARGGNQPFRAFIPRALREVPVLVKPKGKTDFGSGSGKRKADRFIVELARAYEVMVTVDESGLVLAVEVPDLDTKVVLE